MARSRPVYVHRLDVQYPEGSLEPGWAPEVWTKAYSYPRADFTWPKRRYYLSVEAAYRRAQLLRSWGALVQVVSSNRVEWPEA